MHDQNNIFYAVALSVIILICWQYFLATSFPAKPVASGNAHIGATAPDAAVRPPVPAIKSQATAVPTDQRPQQASRQAALARSRRVVIETSRVRGSIALTGGRIDDLSLVQYHETTDPKSPAIELLSPSGSRQPFYAEFGWIDSSSGNFGAADVRDGLASGGLEQSRRGTAGDARLAKRTRPGVQTDDFGR